MYRDPQRVAALRQMDVPSIVSEAKETNIRYHDLKSQTVALLRSINTQRAAQDPPLPPVNCHKAFTACGVDDAVTLDVLDLINRAELRPGHGFEEALDASVARGLERDRLIGGVHFLDYSVKFVEWWLACINAQLWSRDGSWDLKLYL